MGVVREVVVDDGDGERCWNWCGIGDATADADVSAVMVYERNRHVEN